MGEGRPRGDEAPPSSRLTVSEAADQLGITETAVRSRIKRGTLRAHRESGRVYVVVEGAKAATHRDEATAPPTDQSELVEVLKEQLEAERQAHAESRRLLAAALERIPALEPPSEARGSPEPGEGQSDRGNDAPQEPQAAPQRPWWRRVFGG